MRAGFSVDFAQMCCCCVFCSTIYFKAIKANVPFAHQSYAFRRGRTAARAVESLCICAHTRRTEWILTQLITTTHQRLFSLHLIAWPADWQRFALWSDCQLPAFTMWTVDFNAFGGNCNHLAWSSAISAKWHAINMTSEC